jgi:hypothetical protein
MGVGGQYHAPAALPPRKIRYPLYRRLSGPQVRSGRVPTGIQSPDRPARSESLHRLRYPAPAESCSFGNCDLSRLSIEVRKIRLSVFISVRNRGGYGSRSGYLCTVALYKGDGCSIVGGTKRQGVITMSRCSTYFTSYISNFLS